MRLHFVVGLLPAEIQVIAGESLRVTCIISNRQAGVCDSSQLAFDFQKGPKIELLDDGLIDQVNSTVAVLNYPEMSIDWNKGLVGCYMKKCSEASVSRQMHIYCKYFRLLFCSLFCILSAVKMAHEPRLISPFAAGICRLVLSLSCVCVYHVYVRLLAHQ